MITQIVSGLVTSKLCKRISGHDVWIAAHIQSVGNSVPESDALESAEFHPLFYDVDAPRLGG